MKCPACGLVAYPRVAPAMITLVTRGEPGPDQEALLAQGVNFRGPMYSCLAGFVEPGEDLEGAVVREVREEVGITVGDVQYVSSQPWPFPHSLMIGFRAAYRSGDLVLQQSEIVDANWYRRDDAATDPARDLDRPQTDRRLDRGRLNSRNLLRSTRSASRSQQVSGWFGRSARGELVGEPVEDDLGALHPMDR